VIYHIFIKSNVSLTLWNLVQTYFGFPHCSSNHIPVRSLKYETLKCRVFSPISDNSWDSQKHTFINLQPWSWKSRLRATDIDSISQGKGRKMSVKVAGWWRFLYPNHNVLWGKEAGWVWWCPLCNSHMPGYCWHDSLTFLSLRVQIIIDETISSKFLWGYKRLNKDSRILFLRCKQ
jgi:hypothetical protein